MEEKQIVRRERAMEAVPALTSHTQSASPSSTAAAASGGGHFFLLNNVLCKTAEDAATFRPADVFEHPDQQGKVHTLQSLCPHLSRDTAADATARRTDLLTDFARNTAGEGKPFHDDTPELDDLVFNTMGVLTGGALVKPFEMVFMDFGSPDEFAPDALAPLQHKSRNGAADEEMKRDRNLAQYELGNFKGIQPTGFLGLISCVEPVAEDGTSPFMDPETGRWLFHDDADYLAWPRSLALLASHKARAMAEHHVQMWCAMSGLASPTTRQSRGRQTLLDAWRDVEALRLHDKRRWCTQTFLTPVLTSRMQYEGRTLASGAFAAAGSVIGADGLPTTSPASLFSCFTGRPSLERGKLIRRRDKIRPFQAAGQKELLLSVDPRPHHTAADLPDLPLALVETEHRHLHAPDARTATARRRAWWVFRVYYPFLGVAVVRGPPQRFVIRDGDGFSAAECVSRKCQAEALARQKQSPGPSTRPKRAPLKQISEAWADLTLHQEGALMERLGRVEAYLAKLNAHRAATQRRAKRSRSPSL